MVDLTIALVAFVGTHFLLSHPLRAPLLKRLGANGFLALAGAAAQESKLSARLGPVWRAFEAQTSYLPFDALFKGKVAWRAIGVTPFIVGPLTYAILVWLHGRYLSAPLY